jgi:hypothetical protein
MNSYGDISYSGSRVSHASLDEPTMQYTAGNVPETLTSGPSLSGSSTTVVCQITSSEGQICRMPISIEPSNLRMCILSHFSSFHPLLAQAAQGAEEVEQTCPWLGCACAPQSQRRDRCAGREDVHPAHVTDLAEHIMNSHLDLRYSCDLCGHASWTSKAAVERHRKGRSAGRGRALRPCQGRTPARCVSCCRLFESVILLESHLQDGTCHYSAVGATFQSY